MAAANLSNPIVVRSFDGSLVHATGTDNAEMMNAMNSFQLAKDQYRALYEGMKEQYGKLTDECEAYKKKLENSVEEQRLMQEKFRNIVDKLQMENRKKTSEIEDMKTKLLDESKIDQIRDRLADDIEGPYKFTIQQLTAQLEQTKIELNKVRIEFNNKTKEYGSDLSQKEKIMSEIELKNEREIAGLRKERDLLQQHVRQEHQKDMNFEQTRSRELQQYKNRLEQLSDELNQAQQAKLHAEQVSANAQRELLKERSLMKTNMSLIENERDSLKQQLNTIHQEFTNLSERLTNVNRQLHEKDLRLSQISSEQENLQHRLKVESANHKIDLAKLQRSHLEEQERLNLQNQELQEKIAALSADKNKLQMTIQEKEQKLLATIQSTREDEWKKISEVTNEKLDLEAQVNILKKSQDERQKQCDLERDRLMEQIKSLEKSRDDLNKENLHMNNSLKQINDCQHELEREQEKSRDLYRKCAKLESQLSSTNGIEQELTEINFKLKNELSQMMHESQVNKQELHQMNNQCTATIENVRRAFLNERNEMEQKIEHLKSQLKQQKKTMNELQKERNQYQHKYENYTKKLADKSQLIETKLNEIKQKELSLQNTVSLQVHNQVKRQLTQILRKHAQFEAVLNHSQSISQSFEPKHNHDDLDAMLTRIDRLSDDQHNQMNEFIPVKESSNKFSRENRPLLSPIGKASSSSFSSKDKRLAIHLRDDDHQDELDPIYSKTSYYSS